MVWLRWNGSGPLQVWVAFFLQIGRVYEPSFIHYRGGQHRCSSSKPGRPHWHHGKLRRGVIAMEVRLLSVKFCSLGLDYVVGCPFHYVDSLNILSICGCAKPNQVSSMMTPAPTSIWATSKRALLYYQDHSNVTRDGYLRNVLSRTSLVSKWW